MDALEDRLSSLTISHRSEPSDAVYLLDLSLQPPPGGAVAVSCSDFTLRLHNQETLRLLGSYSGHKGPICRVTFSNRSPNHIYSASADGTVRMWDVRSFGKDSCQIFSSEAGHSFCSFDLSCTDSLLCAGTEQINNEDSFLVFWDARKPGSTLLGVYSESHSDDITQVRFHPTDKDRLATGSTDGLVNVFDLKRGEEEEALVLTCNSESSASALCWSGEEYTQLLCVSHDEGLKLWDTKHMDSEEALTLYATEDARSNQGSSAVDYLIGGHWLPSEQRLLVVGGSTSGDLHLFSCDVSGLKLVRTLSHGHASTVRCFGFESHGLFTGGEDGRLLHWTTEREEEEGERTKRDKRKSESAMKKSRPHKKPKFNRVKTST